MEYLLIAGLILVNLIIALFIAVAFFNVMKVYRQIKSLVVPAAGQDNSDLEIIIGQLADRIAIKTVDQAKVTLMGYRKEEVRQDKAIKGAIAQDVIAGQSPLIGTLLNLFPSVRKMISKNPDLAGAAMQQLLPMAQSKPGNNGHDMPYNIPGTKIEI